MKSASRCILLSAEALYLVVLYLVFNSYRDQLEISNAEEQGVSDHPYSVEVKYVEHGNHDLKGAKV